MKKNIIYSLLLVVAVLFAGCEDRLDIAKHGNMGVRMISTRPMSRPSRRWLPCIAV